jgi:hypothetical protein
MEWCFAGDIQYTDYALLRMKRRDITEEEVEEALSCTCNHQPRRDGRWEVNHPHALGVLRVVYRRERAARYVINVMWA